MKTCALSRSLVGMSRMIRDWLVKLDVTWLLLNSFGHRWGASKGLSAFQRGKAPHKDVC